MESEPRAANEVSSGPRSGGVEISVGRAPERRDSLNVVDAAPWTLRRAWTLVAAVGLIDLVWAHAAGLTFGGWIPVGLALAFLGAVAAIYGYTGRSERLADAGNYAALWVAFSIVGAILTYLAATLNFPLRDTEFSAIDSALGFHWLAWFNFLSAHLLARVILKIAYNTMLPQMVLSIIYFAHTERTDRNRDLLWTSMFALILATVVSGVVPALGPHLPGQLPIWSQMLIAIRAHRETAFSLGALQGVIAFPSFHTVMAILLAYAHRPPSRSFWLVALLNGLMVLAVPPAGHHYLIDAISGALVAVVCIMIVRAGSRTTGKHDAAVA